MAKKNNPTTTPTKPAPASSAADATRDALRALSGGGKGAGAKKAPTPAGEAAKPQEPAKEEAAREQASEEVTASLVAKVDEAAKAEVAKEAMATLGKELEANKEGLAKVLSEPAKAPEKKVPVGTVTIEGVGVAKVDVKVSLVRLHDQLLTSIDETLAQYEALVRAQATLEGIMQAQGVEVPRTDA